MKLAYAAEFAATIERAEKQIILARHGRRVLALLDDAPMTPGNVRPAYEEANQARQILNDAEDDLRDWQLDIEDIPFHSHGNQAVETPRRNQEGSIASASQYAGDESTVGDETVLSTQPSGNTSGNRISSGSSATTGPVTQSYAPTRETETPAFV
jgi:hypothetical protein